MAGVDIKESAKDTTASTAATAIMEFKRIFTVDSPFSIQDSEFRFIGR
jgi:hypothetical protein